MAPKTVTMNYEFIFLSLFYKMLLMILLVCFFWEMLNNVLVGLKMEVGVATVNALIGEMAYCGAAGQTCM